MSKLDNGSYELFFKLYYRRLWAYLTTVACGDTEHIEEALQLCFEKVVKNIRVFHSENEFWAWLAVIAKNSYRDCQRRQLRFGRILQAFRSGLEIITQPGSKESNLDIEKLDNALLTLNASELCLVKQKYYEGNSYRQIAAGLGVSEKSIESRLARIRGKLRQLLLRGEGDV